MEIIAIILFIVSILILVYSYNISKKTHVYNSEIDKQNEELYKEYEALKERVAIANHTRAKAEATLTEKENLIKDKENQFDILVKNFDNALQMKEQLSKQAFKNYCDMLDKTYQEKETEFNNLCKNLENAYANQQDKLMQNFKSAEAELESLRSTRDAIIAARIKEQEIKEQRSFYCLTIKDIELQDIKILEKIKVQLNNPRILSMLIWTTYFQKPMTALCNNVLGTDTICGIYKITNQNNDMCYIGQSVDIATRWKSHAKCGLGIDAPAGNKLYKAMQEEGVWNFSWEVLEKCPREELNTKEKYYIELYKTYEYGYNSNIGIKK
jgi:hypothetical protein